MELEEMVEAVNVCDLRKEYKETIIAALRVGQAMRDAAAELIYHNFDNGCVSIEAYIEAWDTATSRNQTERGDEG